MASSGPTWELILACFSVLLLISQTEAATTLDSNSSASINTLFKSRHSAGDTVNLSLYYESLCPYCASFIVNQLVKVFQSDLISVVNLRLIPWGNTIIASNGSWICQHGPDECHLDIVEACAINALPNPETHFKFIRCIEGLRLKNLNNKWESCFGSLGLSAGPIRKCIDSGLAIKLEERFAYETAHLSPPHKFVPWVLVNNLPLQDDYQNFVAYICKIIKGNQLPQVCKSLVVWSNSASAVTYNPVSTMNSRNTTTVSDPPFQQAGKL